MRSAAVCAFLGSVVIAVCWPLSNSAVLAASDKQTAAGETSATAPDTSIAKLIDQIRAAEQQFAHLETTVRKKRFRPVAAVPIKNHRGKAPAPGTTHEEVVIRTVVQGDLCYTKTTISSKAGKSHSLSVERIAAFDGKETRTVEIGSTVNLHDRKTVLLRSLPPHAWPLAIDVPFSDFLAGSRAADITPQPPVDSLLTDNGLAPRIAIEPRIVGEETLKGISCLRLEFAQIEPADGSQSLVRVWLAKERELIPAKRQVLTNSENGQHLLSESRVEDWLEVKKNVWLPKRMTFVTYENQPTKNRKERQRETFVVEKANLAPNYPPEFFRNTGDAAGLPMFSIKDGRLVGSLQRPEKSSDDDDNLRHIADQLRKEEDHYNRLSIDATEVRTTHPLFGGIDRSRTTKLHSLLLDEQAFTDARHETWRSDGSFRPMLWTEGFDGQTYRCFGRHPPPDAGGYAWVSSANYFKKNITLCPALFRPHSALLPWVSSYRRLSDILWPAVGAAEATVEYWAETRSGLWPCSVLAVRPVENIAHNITCLLWLAHDRNLIPVRFEEYRGDQKLPARLEVIDNFSEPLPGVWYPAHKTRYIFRQAIPPATRQGYLFVDQQWDYSVQAVSLNPTAPAGIFSQIVIPEQTEVQYFDKSGKLIAKIPQLTDGVPEMPGGK